MIYMYRLPGLVDLTGGRTSYEVWKQLVANVSTVETVSNSRIPTAISSVYLGESNVIPWFSIWHSVARLC